MRRRDAAGVADAGAPDAAPLDGEPVDDDRDDDGVADAVDNCPLRPNPLQTDGDRDAVGDACDNCVATANAEQLDANGDGFGDACSCGMVVADSMDELVARSHCAVFEALTVTTVNDLSPLARLERVNGDLTISEAATLTSLEALVQLREVGGRLRLTNNAGLTELAMPALETVDSLVITSCDALPDLQDVTAVQMRQLVVDGNQSLVSVAGAGSAGGLEVLGVYGDNALLDLDGIGSGALRNVWIMRTSGLRSLVGLEAANVDYLMVWNNEDLVSLDGLRMAETVTTAWVYDNDVLESVEGLSGIRASTVELRVEDNPMLTGIEGLEEVEQAHLLSIWRNVRVPSLAPLSNLRSADILGIAWNDLLTTLDGLQNLETVSVELHIGANPLLASLDALVSLTSVGELSIHLNASLPQCEADALAASLMVPCDCAYNDELATCP